MAGGRLSGLAADDRQRQLVFAYTMAWLVVIAWVGWLVATGQEVAGYKVPPRLSIIPTAVPWFGAVGGVLISLVGVQDHRYDWDRRYWTWYVARPLVGAFVAIVAVLVFQSGVLAIGANPNETSGDAPKDLFYYVIAFATGYREDAFRTLLRKVVDILFTTRDTGATPTITEVSPAHGPAGTDVTLRGTNFGGVQSVRFGGVDAGTFQRASDAEIQTVVPELDKAGEVDVSVATQDSVVTRPKLFTVEASPDEPA
jgi:IPT/TIG domain